MRRKDESQVALNDLSEFIQSRLPTEEFVSGPRGSSGVCRFFSKGVLLEVEFESTKGWEIGGIRLLDTQILKY